MKNTVLGTGIMVKIQNTILNEKKKFEKGFIQIKFDVKRVKLNTQKFSVISLVKGH